MSSFIFRQPDQPGLSPGAFHLKSSKDLLVKAQRDLDALIADGSSSDHVFNLVVTLASWADWFFEIEERNSSLPARAFDQSPELQAIRHLADNAKHWRALESKVVERNVTGTAAATVVQSISAEGKPKPVLDKSGNVKAAFMIRLNRKDSILEWWPLTAVCERALAQLWEMEKEGRASVEAKLQS